MNSIAATDFATSAATTMTPSNRKVVWMVNSLGYGEDLLYWGPILSRYVQAFPQSQFFAAAGGRRTIPSTEHAVEPLASWHVPLGRRRFSYARHIKLVPPSVVRQVSNLRPDALVISEFTMPSLYATIVKRAAARRRRSVPILLLVESDPLRGDIKRLGWFKTRLRNHIAKRADWVLTNNESGRNYVKQYLPVPADRILCSPYVVSEVAATCPDKSGDTIDPRVTLGHQEELVFLYVGQLVERKGISQLIDGVARLSQTQRDVCRFWLIGDGDQRQQLEQQIEKNQLGDVVKILGRKPYNELSTYYRAADVFVMPTLDDYRALVGFEAIAYGLPLLHSCYDGAAEEIVDEGRNGTIFDPHDPNSIVRGVEAIVAKRKNLHSFGDRSRQISQKYTVDNAVLSLVDATKRCLATT